MSFPTPKFFFPQRVFVATTVLRPLPQVCPDCLGTGRWQVRTPAGESFEVDCGTCYYERVIPQHRYFPHVQTMTVGSVRVDTADREGRFVSYMMEETGVGSGTIWYEEDVAGTEEEAMVRAKTKAHKQNESMLKEAERRRVGAKKRPRRKPKGNNGTAAA